MSEYGLSASTFIRNTFEGAFCVFESMASFMPFVDEMVILDMGSTDGTLRALQEIAEANPKVRIINTQFSKVDAGAFADVANACVDACTNERVLFWQADEIWHQDLLLLMEEQFKAGKFDITFWRYQLKENFQVMKWPPHVIHRVGIKGPKFHFVNDGMNTDRMFEPPMCSNWGMGWFIRWGDDFKEDYTKIPTHEMVMDVSAIGGFIDNIVGKRTLHAPMWHESPNVEGEPLGRWYAREKNNPNWTKPASPFNIPEIMRWHVGRRTYELRASVLDALKSGDTRRLLGL